MEWRVVGLTARGFVLIRMVVVLSVLVLAKLRQLARKQKIRG